MKIEATRLFLGASALASLSLLTPASARAPDAPRQCSGSSTAAPLSSVDAPVPAVDSPSKLDYVVLASLADSPHLLGLSAYRGPAPAAAGD